MKRKDITTATKNEAAPRAVIYCRVSSTRQVEDGHGLESQEMRCRQYAVSKDYDVEAVFPDGVSGGGDFLKRPGMVALLSYLDAQKGQSYVVIFDDLKRFARDTEFHIKLRREFAIRGARVECLNFRFEDTPEGEFIETILAAQGQLERQQNGRQVAQKMRARLMNGYWCFPCPIGYKYEDQKEHGKILVRDEPLASIITEALEGYAMGRFGSQSEVKRYFEGQPAFPKDGRGEVLQQRVTEILTRPIYAGFLGYDRWKVSNIPGKHEALISLETFEKIRARRTENAKAPARKDINLDFPLRGFVLCGDCNEPLTSCWSTGKRKKYPYYLCDTKGCVSYRKSIARERIEGEFADIVQNLEPTHSLFELATSMFKDAWAQRSTQAEHLLATLKRDAQAIEKQIENLLDRIVETSSPAVISAYEAKIEKLERKRLVIQEKTANYAAPKGTFEKSIEHALAFLANPWKIWTSGQFEWKRLVLRLAFAERIAYCRKEGYRTPKTTLPFKVLEGFRLGKFDLVR